ncbi:hypothetical protein C6499_16670 [Candidatus Poribacteria bacterium]|nr:MAG: hypothetical protein C6499_16670 [Candidatus Poribacteria bacterium]
MKFRLREKLKYMFLGGLLTLAGFMFGNMNSDTAAQFGYETIDKLVVQELIVRKDITVMGGGMEPQVLISWDRNGGRVVTYGPKGPNGLGAASLLVAKGDGVVTTQGSKGKTGASLMVNEGGGVLSLFAPDGKAKIVLGIAEGDGVAYLVNKFDEARVLKP